MPTEIKYRIPGHDSFAMTIYDKRDKLSLAKQAELAAEHFDKINQDVQFPLEMKLITKDGERKFKVTRMRIQRYNAIPELQ